jgi:ribosomal protein S12 methylthiotransferase accessory factor
MTTEPTPEVIDARPWLSEQADAFCSTLADGAGAAAALRRVLDGAFLIRSPWAPGLHYVGALLSVPASAHCGALRFSVGGAALDQRAAAWSCLGEAFERLSQIDDGTLQLAPDARDTGATASDGAGSEDGHRAILRAWAAIHAEGPGADDPARIDWLPAVHLGSLMSARLPADLCLRRADVALVPRFALSTGCAAGATRDQALRGAILELVERDAASLWWGGGDPARPVDVAQADGVLAQLRAGAGERHTRLLDITGDLTIPCIAALSTDRDGRGLACGLAARATLAAAARAALLELCQMELALLLARAKARGGAALAPTERAQLERASWFAIDDSPATMPRGLPAAQSAPFARDESVGSLVSQLQGRGVNLYAADLTRPQYPVPAVRVIAPALQLMPCDVVGPRLAAAIARSGGGPGHVLKLPLM